MNIRKTTSEDVAAVMEIIRHARDDFKEAGIDQWQDGYPDEAMIRADIEHGVSYVADSGGQIAATAVIAVEDDPNYIQIDGQWLGEGVYGIVHRIAVSRQVKGQGVASCMVKEAERLARKAGAVSVRIDTHKDNLPMRGLLQKNGYLYCGIITLRRDGALRNAYEKLLDEEGSPTE